MVGPVIAVFNRAPWPLSVTKDGRVTVLKPGLNHVTADLVRFAKNQHPVPGTQDRFKPLHFESLVAIVGSNDPQDELPREFFEVATKERLDRSTVDAKNRNVIERETSFPKGRIGIEAPPAGMVDGSALDRSHG